MREIKFRAWEKQKLQFIDIFDINCFWDILSVWYSYLWEPWTVINDKVTLMQYTGINDRNKKEIFEWDVVEWIVYWEPRVWTVEWSKDWLWVMVWNAMQDYEFTSFEVIGNIYENPNLVHDIIMKNLPF